MVGDEQCEAYDVSNSRASQIPEFFINVYKKYCDHSNGTLIDLGCGPANHLLTLSNACPELVITGYDGSQAMVNIANINVAGNTQITIKQSLFDNVNESADCIMSTQTLHHQHNPVQFWSTVKRLSRPGTKIFVADFERPNDLETVERVNITPLIAEIDLKNSLKAAFTKEEVEQHLKEAGLQLTVVSEPIMWSNGETFLSRLIIHGTYQ